MKRYLLPAMGVALLVASGVLYAMQTGHIRDPQVMADAAERVDQARNIAIEDWTGERIEFTESQLRNAEAAGGGTVRYDRMSPSETGSGSINVMLLCGPHGPISVHPPTACFQGVGYKQVGQQQRQDIRDADGKSLGTFWVTDFDHEQNGIHSRIRTWWTWGSNGVWEAPDNPRMEFAGEPVLYKLYLTERLIVDPDTGEYPKLNSGTVESSETAGGSGPWGDIPDFAAQYLPKLQSELTSPEPGEERA